MTRSCAENRIEVTENRGIPTLADSEIDHLSVRSTCISDVTERCDPADLVSKFDIV